MYKWFKSFILIALIAVVVIVMPGFVVKTNQIQAADEAEWSDDGKKIFDGFTVLEIMPYEGMGELGYLVGGQEPVDTELFYYNTGPGNFSHVQGALQFYRSYEQKDIPENGQIESGWTPAFTDVNQNGYFEYAGQGADRYTINEGQTIYQKVAEGTGTHVAVLPPNARLERVYQGGWETYMRQNVKAYFTDVIPEDSSELFSTAVTYSPYCVTASPDQTGDYDYDAENNRFFLDKGNGSYDVIFEQDNRGSYYMCSDYKIVDDNTGVYSYTDIRYISQAGGDYIINNNGMTFTYQRYWGGTYRWVEDDTALSKPNFSRETVNGVERIWVQGLKAQKRFQYTFKLGIVNNEWLKRNVLGVPSEMANDFPVRVVTVTPAQLNDNLNNEQDLIDDAGLIYINAREHDPLYIRLYEQYSYEGLALPSNSKYNDNNNKKNNELNFAFNDINWTVANKLFRKIAGIGCKKAGVIFDSSFYFDAINGRGPYSNYQRNNNGIGVNYSTNGASSINVVKLFIMVFQRNKIDFYNSFINPDTTLEANRITPQTVASNVSPTGSTASFIRPQASYGPSHNFALYWNLNTFLPWGLNADGHMVQFPEASFRDMGIYHTSIAHEKNYLVDNVLVLFGGAGRTMGSRFIQDIIIVEQDGDGNTTVPTDDLTEIITGGGDGYDDTGGVSYPPGGDVEGPPDAPDPDDIPDDPDDVPDDGSSGSNLRKYKRVLNIQPTAYFEKSETAILEILSDYDVQIINMTSTEFNGSLEDINSFYDMIFMGSAIHDDINYNRFNISTNNRTRFNNTNLNRYFYLEYGDTMRLTNGTDVTYRNNDITTQKMKELIDFLEAGYPIVLDSYLYTMNANVGRVMDGTNIAAFINTSKNKSNYRLLNLANAGQSSFINSIEEGLAITRPRITLKAPISPGGAPVQTAELSIEFQLYPWEGMPHYLKYNAYFYVDRNADGIFDESDKIKNVLASDGSSWEGIMTSENIRRYKYNVSELNGVYQWKLVVERADNSNIRACITGYVSNTKKETLNILHIRDNSSSYSLENEYHNNLDSLIYEYAKPSRLYQYTLKFKSMTVEEYLNQFTADNPYSSSNAEATGKLGRYHILILDNPSDPIDNTYGAASNIKDEIANNLGVIFTKGALGYDRQKDYYNQDGYSFIDHDSQAGNYTYTYNYINRNSLNSNMMIYRDMIGEYSSDLRTDDAYRTNYLTKTNEGSITRYPYHIGKAISITDNYYSNDAVIALDNTLNPKQNLVGWYCLSDTKSPLVREVLGLSGTKESLYHGVYSSSPNDVVNNYYLFSNGPTFYSGINLAKVEESRNADEMKLFINTIYAVRKATESRTIVVAPVVDIIIPTDNPHYVTAEELRDDGHYVLVFELSESSSNMSIDIKFGADGQTYPWMDTVYEYYYGTLGSPIDIGNDKVFEPDKTYAILVSKDDLRETPQLLSITATNLMGHSGTDSVSLAFNQLPVLEIIDPSSKFAYVDVDYTGLADDQDMVQADAIEVKFRVSQISSNYTLSLKSGDTILNYGEGEDYTLYTYVGGVKGSEPITPTYQNSSDMDFILYINMSTMKNINSRDFTITATDTSTKEGSDSLTLLRRSLFPLD
ncbi:MAG: DUF5057 domain-containing protein [Clostridiales bacterium]|nr:DUF5057 domain-containing protein [Clostridiales bacterium]